MDELVLIDLRGIDVDVHDEAVLGEFRHLARHPVIEPHAHCDQQVGLIDGLVGVDAAVHAEHVQTPRIVARKRPESQKGHRDRDAGQPHEFAEFGGGVCRDHTATGVDHGPLGPLDGGSHLGDLLRMRLPHVGVIAGQIHRRIVVGHDLRELNVFRQVDQHGAGSPRGGNMECLPHHPGDVVGVGHQIVMFGDAATDFNNRRLLEGVCPDHARAHLAGERNHRDAVHLRVGDRRDEVERTGATGGHADTRLSSRSRVALGREAAALLVPRKDRPQSVCGAGERLVQRHAGTARVGEDHVHTVADQRLNNHVGTADEGCFGGAGSGDGGHGVDSSGVGWGWSGDGRSAPLQKYTKNGPPRQGSIFRRICRLRRLCRAPDGAGHAPSPDVASPALVGFVATSF